MRKLMDLKISVKTIHVGGDMNRSFRIKSPSVLIGLSDKKVTPLPASSLKGLLRQLACIASRRMGLRDAYYGLFGADISPRSAGDNGSFKRCYDEEELTEKPGKLVLVNKGIEREKIDIMVSPGIMINRETNTAMEDRLWFYQYIVLDEDRSVEYEIWIRGELTQDEKRLLCMALNMLGKSMIGGRITVGHGIITGIEFDKEICKGMKD